MNDIVYEIAEWIVYNIEDLSLQYMEAESFLPLELYIMNRAAVALRGKYNSIEIEQAFDDHRVQTIIDFFREERDEQTDTIH
jgi:hypothetical protein